MALEEAPRVEDAVPGGQTAGKVGVQYPRVAENWNPGEHMGWVSSGVHPGPPTVLTLGHHLGEVLRVGVLTPHPTLGMTTAARVAL